MSTYFKSLDYLNVSNYSNGKAHVALASVQTSARDIARLPVKLRLMTGTFFFLTFFFNIFNNFFLTGQEPTICRATRQHLTKIGLIQPA
jgi:hypothetical protein